MKNLTKIFMALAVALFAFSCVNDATEDAAVKIGGKTTLTLSLDDTRTELGEKENGIYPVTWSVEDQISVNGIASEGLTFDDGAGTANAVFTFNTEDLGSPLCVAYPAADEGFVVFAEEQIHNNSGTTFDVGAATMYGYSNGGSVKLNHLTGVLKIGVVGNATLKSATISTIDRAPIAGAFAIDFATGKVTPTENSTNTIVYQFAGMDGLYLDETEPNYIHVAVPAGTYDELYVALVDDQGGVMYATVKAGDNKPLAAGKVREFSTPITYVPINSDEVFVVKDYESLLAFTTAAAKATSKAPVTKNAVFIGDVEIPSSGWTSVSAENYTGTICGNGHIISGLNNPLFSKLGATVKGLHLTNVNIETSGNSIQNVAALVGNYSGACITHCSTSGTITQDSFNGSSPKRYGSLIAILTTASSDVEISYCVNRCTLNFAYVTKNGSGSWGSIGGIIGTMSGPTKSLTFKGNVNEGEINITGSSWAPSRTAGLIGYVAAFNSAVIEGCVNKGNINFSTNVIPSSERLTYVAGIVADIALGADDRNYTIKNCENAGKITISSPRMQRGLIVGGVVGYVNCNAVSSMTLENLTNTSEVSMDIANCASNHESISGFSNIVGGVVGNIWVSKNATLTVKNLRNSNNVYCGGYSEFYTNTTTNSFTWVFAGGVIGKMAEAANITPKYNFDGLVNTGNVEVSIGVKGINETESYFGALIGKSSSPSIANAKNYGAFKVYQTKEDGTYGTYANAGVLTGSASATFTSSAVGGTFVYGNGAELTSVDLAADNYAKYLFSNRDLTSYAGVSLLTSAPVAN